VPKVSVTVITKNEEANLAAALESVSWADEVIVVDAESTDRTVEIASRFTKHVVTRGWNGYVEQKNHAAAIASHDWILSLDADERVTTQLADEIRKTLEKDPPYHGYRIPRVTWYLGRWIRSTDWYPDYQLRLYDRRAGRWQGAHVHESVALDGPMGYLRFDLEHRAYRDISHHLEKMNRYSSLAARQSFEAGRRASALQLIVHPPLAFLRNAILKGGFRDGIVGVIVSGLNAVYVFLKFAKLRELSLNTEAEGSRNPRG
jgi:glycosyltransferase involved in cell wall biosynthesis